MRIPSSGSSRSTKPGVIARVTTPLCYQDVLYIVKSGGILTSLDRVTGKVLKRGRIPEGLGEYYPSPVAGNGKVFIASSAGRVAVLEAGAAWKVLAVNDLKEQIDATPAIGNDGTLFVRTKSALYCFATAR